MFKLTIGEMNCAVSDFEHDTFCFYTFDARKDIFNLNDGDNGLVRFVQSVNPSDTTIHDSINIVQTSCAEERLILQYQQAAEAARQQFQRELQAAQADAYKTQ